MNIIKATFRRELLIAFRSPGDMVNPLMFFVIAVSLFPLGVGSDTAFLSEIAAGVIWVTALLSVMLSLDSMFRADYEDGSLEQLLLSPQPLYFIVLAKILSHWLVVGLPLVILAPVLASMMALPAEALPTLVGSLLIGTPIHICCRRSKCGIELNGNCRIAGIAGCHAGAGNMPESPGGNSRFKN